MARSMAVWCGFAGSTVRPRWATTTHLKTVFPVASRSVTACASAFSTEARPEGGRQPEGHLERSPSMSPPLDRRAAAAAIDAFLRAIGRDEPDVVGTGARVADMFLDELCAGYSVDTRA